MILDKKRANAELQRKEALALAEIETKFGERLRHYRVQKGVTQIQLAKIAGSSSATIKRIESGQSGLSIMLKHFLRLCRALGVDPAIMIKGLRL